MSLDEIVDRLTKSNDRHRIGDGGDHQRAVKTTLGSELLSIAHMNHCAFGALIANVRIIIAMVVALFHSVDEGAQSMIANDLLQLAVAGIGIIRTQLIHFFHELVFLVSQMTLRYLTTSPHRPL